MTKAGPQTTKTTLSSASQLIGVLALLCSGAAAGADQAVPPLLIEDYKVAETLTPEMAESESTEATETSDLPAWKPVAAEELPENRAPVVAYDASAATAPAAQYGDDRRQPQIAPIFEQSGILTARGKVVLEPALQYGYSSSNRVSLVGYTIIPSLLIGLVDVREVRRDTFTPSLTARWGITNRIEVEAKLPYVYRSDSVLSRPLGLGAGRDQLFSSTGSGIGDVEVTGRYQLNDGGADGIYYVGTLRLKSRTGKDPFEVLTDNISAPNISNELQVELPTGSGFYTVQPGLTLLYPADPAVFFGSLSYQYNVKRSSVAMNTTNGPVLLGEIAPGGVIGFNVGMGLSLNERSSFSIGYDHAAVGKTQINGVDAINAVRTQLGTLLIGFSYRIDKKRTLNFSIGSGVTRDTPDVQLALRLPISS